MVIDEDPEPKRFQIDLFIVHPSIDPEELDANLQIEGHFRHKAGDQRYTPLGTPLDGTFPDTRWRHTVRFETGTNRFADQLTSFVDVMDRHRDYFAQLVKTGGSLCVILSFLGDGHFGDAIPKTTLAKISDLGVDLGIQVFTERQN
ncbi:DUF4279 domain-containing protein [Mesorhizobium sp. LHD-90]|uniref:DUF4279 domain-containing protein n=1 Tax=Mesorhizobium sp. LHD-90 TaxID=3071414 RepID=UPI0027E02482|nr:DUF4279 domain-containing protein [Mesorhizobium sp. LHD-90]MDQ6432971.1 DUF4279 domain-containing protein [Mesorhizobium sp. LHD-90]